VQRPLAVVMVADPTPLTLANLRRLSTWADLVLTEGTTTIAGQPREPQRENWRELLGLQRPELRIITTDLAGEQMGRRTRRMRIQRDSVIPLLIGEPDQRPVLMVDADEFLEPEAVLAAAAAPREEPVRLGLVPLYAGIDRVARSIHCCWSEAYAPLRNPEFRPKREYIVAAPSLATAGQMRGRSPSQVRFGSAIIDREQVFGTHITMTESAERIAVKLANMRDEWVPRVLEVGHLRTMLDAGVHHAGWWIAQYRQPEPWLRELAAEAGLRECGEPTPMDHLRALRAWAQVRLDPLVPDELVAAGDAYVARRAFNAEDFLGSLDEWLASQPVTHTGRRLVEPDAAEGAGAPIETHE